MTKHNWSYCDLCECYITLCGTCGNNVCNSGSGTVDGKPCPDCESSYQEWIANPEKVNGQSMTTPLITRLEEAAEGSRELDAAIWYAVHEPDVDYPGIRTEQTEQGPREVLTCELGSKWADDVGRYTTSIDAAYALAERVLPGWMFAVAGPWTNTVVGRDFYCAEVVACTEESGVGYLEVNELGNNAPTPALALCIAILRANHKDKP